jgi:hypothetical protein
VQIKRQAESLVTPEKAADTVADETARLMGEAQADAQVIPLKA